MSRKTVFQAEKTASARAPGQHHAWCVGGRGRKPVWLKQSGQRGKREARRAERGRDRSCRV